MKHSDSKSISSFSLTLLSCLNLLPWVAHFIIYLFYNKKEEKKHIMHLDVLALAVMVYTVYNLSVKNALQH